MNYFSDYKIQKKVLGHFKSGLTNNRLAHAYLFYGPEGTGKDAFALELAKAINCHNKQNRPCNECPSCHKIMHLNHPDVHFVFPVKKDLPPDKIGEFLKLKSANPYAAFEKIDQNMIRIDQIRQLKNEAKYMPHEADRKVYIISDADRMNKEAANSFLKILEEPPEQLLIILTSANLNALPITIRSRCHVIYFSVLDHDSARSVVERFHPSKENIDALIRLNENNLKKVFSSFDQGLSVQNKLIYEYMRTIAQGDIIGMMETIDHMTASRDRNFLLDILNLLILWFKDVIHLITLQDDSIIINKELQDNITGFAKLYQKTDFNVVLRLINQAQSEIKQNANGKILLTNLGFKIREKLIKTELQNAV